MTTHDKSTHIRRRERPVPQAAPEFIWQEQDIPCYTPDPRINEYRHAAWKTCLNTPMPTISEEAWRRTNISALNSQTFRLAGLHASDEKTKVPEDLFNLTDNETSAGQMLLTSEKTLIHLDAALDSRGVIFCDLQTAEKRYPDLLLKVLGKVVPASDGKFAALSAAMARQGFFLYVPRGIKITDPLHSLLYGAGINQAFISHLLIYLEEDSELTCVHEYASKEDEVLFHSGLIEILVGKNARLQFIELQSWGNLVWNFAHERIVVEENGTVEWIVGTSGSGLTKNFSELSLRGRNSRAKMSGFYITNGQQHLDMDTQQNHFAEKTFSDLLYKGVLLDSSRSVWQGMIHVDPKAMKTDGYQVNRNLILSPNARADSIPGLEIQANDVRCSHGTTIGKIDAGLVFYLETRGIPKKESEKLIVEGFFEPIIDRIPFEDVKKRFKNVIHQKMKWVS